LLRIQSLCNPTSFRPIQELIAAVVEPNVEFAKNALELRTQRNYAIKVGALLCPKILAYMDEAGRDGMMDIARQAFKEAQDDAYDHVQAVAGMVCTITYPKSLT
jgi:DNA mismatch repair protein MSH4